MRDRILDISETGARLSVRLDQLCIEPHEGTAASLPLEDIAVLVLGNPAIQITQAVLTGLAEKGGILITCNSSRLPAGMMVPLVGHHLQGLHVQAQAQASLPTKKRIWKALVRAKVVHQGLVLEDLRGRDAGLPELAKQVRSGDPGNLEARAARIYWPILFDPAFRRSRELDDANRYLNYGYAVLRAAVARAICAAGLLPSMGIHHHNRYDAFPLADDLMEPFRPLVDRAAWELADRIGPDAPLDPEAKTCLISPMLERYQWQGESRTLFDILSRIGTSLASALAGRAREIDLPDFSRFHLEADEEPSDKP